MHKFVLSPPALTAIATLLLSVSPASAQQQPAQPNAPQQTQAVPQPSQMPQGAWPGAMPGPMHRGMMQPGQQAGPQNMQQPQGGPMMRGPMMHRGMPMQQQMPQMQQQMPQMQQQGAQGQPDAQQGAQGGAGMMPGQMQQGPMMRGPMIGRDMQGPMMGGPGMHHGPMGGPMMGGPGMHHGPMGGPMMGGMCPMGGPDFTAGRMAFLKAELAITEAQQEAFDALAKVVKSHAEGRHERHQAMMQNMAQAQTPLDRLAARIAMMEMRVGMMKEMKEALDKLYAGLTDEQKQKANFLLPGVGGMRCMM